MKMIEQFSDLVQLRSLIVACCLLLLFTVHLYSQVPVINNGSFIYVDSAIIYVDGDAYFQNNGTVNNSGNIHITGNWTNNNPSGNVFASGLNGWVHLRGDTQTIGGSNFTSFNKLELSGSGVKQLNNVDVEIEDTLALNDREFAAGNNIVRITGTSLTLVTRTNTMTGGFVSGINAGGLSRNMASAGPYIFPVGSNIGITRYRPVELTPDLTSANTFKVRMANVNPTSETYDILQKDSSLCDVNSDFYHRIEHINGTSSADIKIYYDAPADGNYQTIAHWQSALGGSEWENTGNCIANTNSPLSDLTVNGWNDFSTTPFALAKLAPVAGISTNAVCQGSNAVFSAPPGFANYEFFVNGISQGISSSNTFSGNLVNGDSVKVVLWDVVSCQSASNNIPLIVNPVPDVTITGPDTINIGQEATLIADGASNYQWQHNNQNGGSATVSPAEETVYTVIGTDNNGCTDTSTITIFVDTKCVHWLPNIFSPNGDGHNDEFKVLGRGMEWIYLSVYDRWGNKVFETNDINGEWDGKYRGTALNTSVFVYIMKGKCLNSAEEFEQHGNVTLTK